MKQDKINEALLMAKRLKYFFVCSVDKENKPHMAAANRLMPDPQDLLEVFLWPCPVTISNLQFNKQITLVIWDAAINAGFQIAGVVENMQEYGVLNGYSPELESGRKIPQVYWRIMLRVDAVMEFKNALHDDAETD